jgi:hypothetical protein
MRGEPGPVGGRTQPGPDGPALGNAELAALATLDLGEDAAVDSDLRVEF